MRLGVVGDLRLAFDERDVELLDAESYDALLFAASTLWGFATT